jgi:hypothetical protein
VHKNEIKFNFYKIPTETPVDDVFDAYEVINNIQNDEDFINYYLNL